MRFIDRRDLAQSLVASYNGLAIHLERLHGYCIIVDVVGAPNGTLKLQASNNAFTNNVNNNEDPAAVWVDIPGSSKTLSGSPTQILFNASDAFYNAVRLVYTATSGTGSSNTYIYCKAIGGS